MPILRILALLPSLALAVPGAAAAVEATPPAPAGSKDAPSKEKLVAILTAIDESQRNPGDYKGLAYLEQKEKDKADVVREVLFYRRNADRKLVILFTKPKAEAGKGYLRIESNLWFYDPTVGRWERRTERERIGGSNSRRGDWDESRLAEEYDVAWEGQEKLGAYTVHKLKLTVKPGVDVADPVIRLWTDVTNDTMMKRQDFALSGRLMRTLYYPKWEKQFSETKKMEVWFPREIRIYDEIEKGDSTLIHIKSMDYKALDPNLFTKAWLESKSR
jgi:hypothetical protein